MNPLQLLRLKSIFGQDSINPDPSQSQVMSRFDESGQPTYESNPNERPIPTLPHLPDLAGSIVKPQTDQNDGMGDIAARMAQLYTPSTTEQDKLSAAIDHYPIRPEPSMKRRIGGAVLGGLSDIGSLFNAPAGQMNPNPTHFGPAIADEFTGKHAYNDQVTDWENKIKPIESSANIERQANSNERQMAYQTISQQLQQDALNHRANNDAEKARIADFRSKIYALKAAQPNMKFLFPKGGNVIAVDTKTGDQHDTGIPTGTMDEIDKLNLQHENKIEEIHTTGQENRETKVVVPGKNTTPTQSTRPPSASQNKVEQALRARQLANSNPALGQFITVGTNGLISIGPNKRVKPTDAQLKQINDYIYGSPTNSTNTQVKDPKRDQAIKVLTDNKKPVTEANIKHVMDQIK